MGDDRGMNIFEKEKSPKPIKNRVCKASKDNIQSNHVFNLNPSFIKKNIFKCIIFIFLILIMSFGISIYHQINSLKLALDNPRESNGLIMSSPSNNSILQSEASTYQDKNIQKEQLINEMNERLDNCKNGYIFTTSIETLKQCINEYNNFKDSEPQKEALMKVAAKCFQMGAYGMNSMEKNFEDAMENTINTDAYMDFKNYYQQHKGEIEPTFGSSSIVTDKSIHLDFMDMELEDPVWLNEVFPSNTSRVYSYLKDIPGETYYVINGTVKNISGEGMDIGNMISKFVFNQKYKYFGDTKGESAIDGNDFYDDYVKPLETKKFIIVVSVPDEIKNNYTGCNIELGFDNQFHNNSYTSIEEVENKYKLSF